MYINCTTVSLINESRLISILLWAPVYYKLWYPITLTHGHPSPHVISIGHCSNPRLYTVLETWGMLHNHRGRSPRRLCNILKVSKQHRALNSSSNLFRLWLASMHVACSLNFYSYTLRYYQPWHSVTELLLLLSHLLYKRTGGELKMTK